MPTKADEIFREFNRYTGDGKPGEPVAAPLPIGDPSSGVKHLKKREIREWANDFSEDMGGLIGQAGVWAGEANDAAEQTALDRIATGEDATATGEDAAQTALDRIATGADATQTALDRIATGADATQAALDRIATGADAVATAADRVQTGIDRTAASTSASDADTARIAAELAQSNAEGILDSFDDRYLGVKAVAPTVDNDGDPLVIGALYYNSTDNQMLIYNGASWEGLAAGIELALKKASNLSDLSSTSTALTNLGFSAYVKTLVVAANAAAMRTLLGLNSAATGTLGVLPWHVPQLDGSGKLRDEVMPAWSWEYTSAETTVAFGTVYTFPHGLGADPDFVDVRLVCKTASNGFSVGQVIRLASTGSGATGLTTIMSDATNVIVAFATTHNVLNPAGTTATLTIANFKMVVRAS